MSATETTDATIDAAGARAMIDEVWGRAEPLHPDLVPYLRDNHLRHPLVYSIFHFDVMNAMINAQYEAKREAVAKALADRDGDSYMWLHERPYRLEALLEIERRKLVEPTEFARLVGRGWIDSENIASNPKPWWRLVEKASRHPEFLMADEDRAALAALPDAFPVWQGHTTARTDGWSWTVNRKVAVWFAHRFAQLEGSTPRITKGIARRDDVLAYFGGRGEFEVIVPDKLISGQTTRTVPGR